MCVLVRGAPITLTMVCIVMESQLTMNATVANDQENSIVTPPQPIMLLLAAAATPSVRIPLTRTLKKVVK